jgi:hypothetical protein
MNRAEHLAASAHTQHVASGWSTTLHTIQQVQYMTAPEGTALVDLSLASSIVSIKSVIDWFDPQADLRTLPLHFQLYLYLLLAHSRKFHLNRVHT